MRYGFSLAPVDPNNGTNLVFPIMGHFIYGASKHKFDAGIGQALSVTTKLGLFISAPMSFGYRLQPEEKNLYWRFAYTPLVSYIVDFQWQHWGGITFGYHFNRKKDE
ncbi:MAG: hypothetical protein MK193_15360 [Lentisphaeria bacterium]|nr:hypothetical protein [Lentisphaeria bacterium]